jgi:hypothetical protein
MHRIALFALFGVFAFAQPNEPFKPKPPAGVEVELRARIEEFYDLHIKSQFRKAETLVADDTKDFFYSANKPTYVSCEISRIDYSDNFTKAKAVMVCEQYVLIPGFTDHPMKVPIPSTWKMENGKWYWYVDPEALRNSPFGKMTPGPYPAKGGGPAAPPTLNNIPTTTDFLMGQVQLDKSAVRLKAGETAEVTITNGAHGTMTVSVPLPAPGIEAKLDKSALPAGGKATLTLRAAKGARSGAFNVQVEPTMQLLPVQVTVVE